MKIFYRPNTLEIVGMSDSEESMSFPFIEIKGYLHSCYGVELKKKGKKIIAVSKKDGCTL